MDPARQIPLSLARLDDKQFRRMGEFIHAEYGIRMPDSKKTMLEARLQKRLKALGMTSFGEYMDYLFSREGAEYELVEMVNVVTTNKTDFFREPAHFDFLVGSAVPELIRLHQAGLRRPLSVWSAGCSTGEEPYTISMVLSEFAGRVAGFRFGILATDISTNVLEKAAAAIYHEDRIQPVPESLKRKYLLRSKDRSKRIVRVVPGLRSLVSFKRVNFMDSDFGFSDVMDVIFCRNVIIYFDRPTQEALLNRLCRHLVPGGFIFMGHSETLNGLDVPLVSAAPTVYRKPGKG